MRRSGVARSKRGTVRRRIRDASMILKPEIRTSRLVLRRWRSDDAPVLLAILSANTSHLEGWIPAAVSSPAPVPELAARLTGYVADFNNDVSWRFAIVRAADGELLGEVSLFPRSAAGRVEYAAADRTEIGYWLRRDATGRGYATEAARALLRAAASLPRVHSIEIRCDPWNVASAAIPARLGFFLSNPPARDRMVGEPDADPVPSVWVLPRDAVDAVTGPSNRSSAS